MHMSSSHDSQPSVSSQQTHSSSSHVPCFSGSQPPEMNQYQTLPPGQYVSEILFQSRSYFVLKIIFFCGFI